MHRLTVVTRNVRDFVPFGVTTLDPFRPEAGAAA
jgi:predicted nucleic acid-binding protein